MFEKLDQITVTENQEEILDLSNLSDQELDTYTGTFLGEDVSKLSQQQIEARLLPLLTEISRRGLDSSYFFSFALPDKVTAEEIQSGNSSWAKVYKSLLSLSKTEAYKQNPELQIIAHEFENIISQNPQMMGPVAMWETAKDIMWRRDVPSHVKGGLMGSMTYALTFFDADKYESELLKNIDLEDPKNYSEIAHMFEALKQFWSSGHEAYAEDRVPDFYLRVLRQIKDTPKTNYLLSIRAQEILSLLERSEMVPDEVIDIRPFELSRDTYASTQVSEGLMIVPKENNDRVRMAVANFDAHEELITPPQHVIDEALARGEEWIMWQPSRELMKTRERLFDEMHQYATISIEEEFSEFSVIDSEQKQELLFDYEYLVSRPVREIIQREFDCKLTELSVREQFYFLNYLKRTTIASVDSMKSFTSLYGVEGMRSFLINEVDEDASENIVVFGSMVEAEIAKKVFDSYAQTIDHANSFYASVGKNADQRQKQLLSELGEGMLRRTGHLFEAAKQMSLWEYAGKEQTMDLVQAFKGVGKINEICSNLKSGAYLIERDHSREQRSGGSLAVHYFNLTEKETDNHFALKVTIREEGDTQGEARINFELFLDELPEDSGLRQTFEQTVSHSGKGSGRARTQTKSVVRLGFDLDTRSAEKPRFSFDMGRHKYEDEFMSRSGDLLGNILEHTAPEGHNLTTFSNEFSNPATFKELAKMFNEYFDEL